MKIIKKITNWIMKRPWVRWIIFLPAAFLSWIIGSFLWIIFYTIVWGKIIGSDNILSKIFKYPLNGIIISFIFVYVGVYIVPKKKKTVSIILVILVIIESIISQLSQIFIDQKVDYWMVLFSVFSIFGSIISHKYIKSKDFFNKKNKIDYNDNK